MSVKYSFEDHIVNRQYEAEQEMLKEFEAGNYTIANPLIKYNAYLVNPLSAVVCFHTEKETAITVTVLGKTPQGNISHTFPKAKKHVLPIVGLYSDYQNRVEIRAYRGESNIITIDVPDVFDGKEVIYSMDTTPEYLQDNIILVSPAGEDLAVGFDYAGDARWHMTIPCVFDVKRLKNGNLIMGSHRVIQMPYYMSGLYEISPCGKIYKEFRLPGGYHHDEFEMEDGNLLSLTDDLTSETVEDMCVLIDRNTGEILKTWDYKKFLDPKKVSKSGSWSDHDWFHNNAVWYDKNTNSLTFSGRHIDSMVNIDYETGELNWIIGDPEGWPEEMQKYFFKPVGNNFGWQYEQHACVITPDGDVMCFDNHHYGSKNPEKYLAAKDNYSRGVRYKINTDDMTIEQVWQYGKERGAEFFSCYICNCEYYERGHYLVHSGGIGKLNGEWMNMPGAGMTAAIDDGSAELSSITVEVKDDVVLYEMHLPANYYRAEKLHLYDEGDAVSFGRGEILGSIGMTEEFLTEVPAEDGGMVPDSYKTKIAKEADRLVFKASFEKGTLVMLNLEGENGSPTRHYFVPTTKRPFLAMCVGTFLEHDERAVEFPVSGEGIEGTYKVTVTIDEKKYDTGVTVNF